MQRQSKFNDLQEEEGLKFKALFFKKEDSLIQVVSYSVSDDQLQLTLRSRAAELGNSLLYQGKHTLGPANTTITESVNNGWFDEQWIEITIEEDTVFVVLDDEKCYPCTKIKYRFDAIWENPQILCCRSKEYIELSVGRVF